MGIRLNAKQQEAVDHIYGPLLVLAGPGTGKTQLLSARIANILTKTDASPQNILCLTFTEKAAQNMRDRLANIIKDDAYDVHINTYHGFGSDIIRSYPEYFEEVDLETGKDTRLERPIDDLQRIQIFTSIVGRLPYSSPLVGAHRYVNHVSSTISDLKKNLYTPERVAEVAANNLKLVRELSPKIAEHFGEIKSLPRTADKSIELFSGVLDILTVQGETLYSELAELATDELEHALTEAAEINKSTPLTAWKNKWLTKDSNNHFQFTDEAQHLRIAELAKIYEQYQSYLNENQLYDFDDMILKTLDKLKNADELRFNLQEKYQFILLDEFQDTNAAQFDLVKKLCDNPVNEGQPNVFAVGDDDQAIYAFQGARVSNMLGFINSFRDVKVLNLTENYRSHPDVIHTAHMISGQIESRLHTNLEGIEKTLDASSNNLPKEAAISRHEFDGIANEYSWIANKAQELISSGVNPKEIAILAPKHKYLESIVPFLSKNQTPITYEKREDILSTQLMIEYRLMIKLLQAISKNEQAKMDELFPQVLSLDFFDIDVVNIWKTNWLKQSNKEKSWAELSLDNENLSSHVKFFLSLGAKCKQLPLEFVLDYLTGSAEFKIDNKTKYNSPLKNYYFSNKDNDTLAYYEALTNLSTIRQHIRTHQSNENKILEISDFEDIFAAYEAAGQPLINTHPVAQSSESVQLMTAYKAKGLEFEHVFLVSVHDDIWGKKARANTNKISLPANLQHVRYQGSSEDELRRLLFVAVTRAKHGLYLTSHALKDDGKSTEPVKYLLELEEDGTRKSTVLPDNKQELTNIKFTASETMQQVDTMWHSRHLKLDAELKGLLQNRLDKYQMAPTHLNTFLDLQYGGPETFLIQTLLRFPQAPGEDGEFGNAIHITLDWLQKRLKSGEKPTIKSILAEFDNNLAKRFITADKLEDFRARGRNALEKYLTARTNIINLEAESEVDFRGEGVIVEGAHLSGKIDRLEINKQDKTVKIVDYKTGQPHKKWEKTTKLFKYKQQLYFYKLLIEGSHTWSNYKVVEARLEFVEPDSEGNIVDPLVVEFDPEEEKEIKKLIKTVWQHIKTVDFPDTANYDDSYKGSMEFIQDLLK